MRTLHLLDEAEEDLDRAADFYEEQDKGYGDCFHACLLAEMRVLVPLAGTHSRRHGFYFYMSDSHPYGVYYRIEGDVVAVYAVLDQRRHPRTLSRTLRDR